MHDIIDTETVDAAEELFWPHEFKLLLRGKARSALIEWLRGHAIIKKLHHRESKIKEMDYDSYLDTLATKIIIGAENGADDTFETIHGTFFHGLNLPCIAYWIENNVGNEVFTVGICLPVQEEIREAYRNEHLYEHIYEDYYREMYPTFDVFIDKISEYVVIGIINGAENMLRKILRSFIYDIPLPPAMRHPRAIKGLH